MRRSNFALCLCVVVVCNFSVALSSEVSSKLDFGSDSLGTDIQISSESQLLEGKNLQVRNAEGGQLICSSEGCNTTKAQAKTDGIVTDVLVHVKTSGGTTSNTVNESVPDVPVVVGYAGASPPSITSDSLVNSKPLIVSNIGEVFPSTNRRIDNGGTFFVPSDSPPYEFPETVPLSRTYQGKYNPDYKQVSYDNDVLYMPYFDPSLHTHNFGESAPPQLVWNPKGGVSFNPLEFKRFNTRPSNQWSTRLPAGYQEQGTTPGYTTCTCNNPGLTWYPTTPRWSVGGGQGVGIIGSTRQLKSRNRQGHIDDKLGSFD